MRWNSTVPNKLNFATCVNYPAQCLRVISWILWYDILYYTRLPNLMYVFFFKRFFTGFSEDFFHILTFKSPKCIDQIWILNISSKFIKINIFYHRQSAPSFGQLWRKKWKICHNLRRSKNAVVKGTIFYFFRGHERWSFIHSKPKIVFFFFREAGKKKMFFSLEKFIGHSFGFWWSPIFFNKSWLCFFFLAFLWFFCVFFPRKSSRAIHSFNFWSGKKNKPGKNKKQLFHFRFPPKMRKNELFRGKNKKRYLCTSIIVINFQNYGSKSPNLCQIWMFSPPELKTSDHRIPKSSFLVQNVFTEA